MYIDRTLAAMFPSHQGFPDHWASSDTYIPTADGLQILSNGYGFYEVRSVPTQHLYKPGPAAADVPADDPPARDQFRPPRFFSPEEPDTLPRTPTSTTASAPSPSPATPPEPQSPSPAPLSAEDARALIEAYVQRATWLEANAFEPLVGDAGVPASALFLARPGDSVYRCFVDTVKDRRGRLVYHCRACGFKSDRLHRLLGHQRAKRGHRPFACPDEGCDFRGYTVESLGDHRSCRNGLQACERCGEIIVQKNMPRHLQMMH